MNKCPFPIGRLLFANIQYVVKITQQAKSQSTKEKKSAAPYNKDVGDIVYLYSDRDKSRARSRYHVVSVDGEWCFVKKFSGNQLSSSSYKVKREECYLVPNDFFHYFIIILQRNRQTTKTMTLSTPNQPLPQRLLMFLTSRFILLRTLLVKGIMIVSTTTLLLLLHHKK